jgi:hypothetical protein
VRISQASIKVAGFVVGLAAVLLFRSCAGRQGVVPGAPPLALFPSEIVTFNWAGNTEHRYKLTDYPWGAGRLQDGSTWFEFPSYPTAAAARSSENVVRVWEVYSQQVTLTHAPAFAIKVTADPGTVFFWKTQRENTCNTAASVRVSLDGWDTGAYTPTRHWWARSGYTLGPGAAVIGASLAPAEWSDEQGQGASLNQDTQAGFAYTLSKAEGVALSFGGGCFYGHGVSTIGGRARFTMRVTS